MKNTIRVYIEMIKTVGEDMSMPLRIFAVILAVLTLTPMFLCGYFKDTDI